MINDSFSLIIPIHISMHINLFCNISCSLSLKFKCNWLIQELVIARSHWLECFPFAFRVRKWCEFWNYPNTLRIEFSPMLH